jgi:hypothetical protein
MRKREHDQIVRGYLEEISNWRKRAKEEDEALTDFYWAMSEKLQAIQTATEFGGQIGELAFEATDILEKFSRRPRMSRPIKEPQGERQ